MRFIIFFLLFFIFVLKENSIVGFIDTSQYALKLYSTAITDTTGSVEFEKKVSDTKSMTIGLLLSDYYRTSESNPDSNTLQLGLNLGFITYLNRHKWQQFNKYDIEIKGNWYKSSEIDTVSNEISLSVYRGVERQLFEKLKVGVESEILTLRNYIRYGNRTYRSVDTQVLLFDQFKLYLKVDL